MLPKLTKKLQCSLKLKLEKMEQYIHQLAYVILKDHKENFKTKFACQLINPAKSKIGIVSKVELEIINKAIINQAKLNPWHDTQTLTYWFNSLQNKAKGRFIKFNTIEFYLSIAENLLDNAVSYAQTLTTILDIIDS